MKAKKIIRIFGSSIFIFLFTFVLILIAFPKTRTYSGIILGFVFTFSFFILNFLLFVFLQRKQNFTKFYCGLLLVSLVVLDQLIKALCINCLGDNVIYVLNNYIHIDLIKNPYQTVVLQIAGSILPSHIVGLFKVLLIVFFVFFLAFFQKKYKMSFNSSFAQVGIMLILCSAICTTIDSFFWGCSVDYILLVPLYTAYDLKDIFSFIGIGFLSAEFIGSNPQKDLHE